MLSCSATVAHFYVHTTYPRHWHRVPAHGFRSAKGWRKGGKRLAADIIPHWSLSNPASVCKEVGRVVRSGQNILQLVLAVPSGPRLPIHAHQRPYLIRQYREQHKTTSLERPFSRRQKEKGGSARLLLLLLATPPLITHTHTLTHTYQHAATPSYL